MRLIKHINSTPLSRKQESPGVFWTSCPMQGCDLPHNQHVHQLSEISDWSCDDTSAQSVCEQSSQIAIGSLNSTPLKLGKLTDCDEPAHLLTPRKVSVTPFSPMSTNSNSMTPAPAKNLAENFSESSCQDTTVELDVCKKGTQCEVGSGLQLQL